MSALFPTDDETTGMYWPVNIATPDRRTPGDILGELDRIRQELGPIVPRMVRLTVRARVELEVHGIEVYALCEQSGIHILECAYMPTNRVAIDFADGRLVVMKIREDQP